ncbi:MAG: hypothetical protein IKE22_00420, partial [Atopobiaceae bacterium]|nr:hypothetical protein [Atopobiaceae bacterium]
QEVDDHWNYVDDHTEDSTLITFASEPQVDDEGTFWFQFDENGLKNAAVVSGLVYMLSEDGSDLIALGETYDVYGDWNTGQFSDGFDGGWLSLPDGQSLNLAVVSATEDYIIYTSPISLNGKDCFLRMRQSMEDGSVEVEGAWTGMSEAGAMDRDIVAIKKGDEVVPLYKAVSVNESMDVSDYEGVPYKVTSNSLEISYALLPEGDYFYGFSITDPFGDTYYSECAQFEVGSDGKIYFK